jgi:hypothetical protein
LCSASQSAAACKLKESVGVKGNQNIIQSSSKEGEANKTSATTEFLG